VCGGERRRVWCVVARGVACRVWWREVSRVVCGGERCRVWCVVARGVACGVWWREVSRVVCGGERCRVSCALPACVPRACKRRRVMSVEDSGAHSAIGPQVVVLHVGRCAGGAAAAQQAEREHQQEEAKPCAYSSVQRDVAHSMSHGMVWYGMVWYVSCEL
jgi:hypothetical protein